jgi:hypothetical protein
LKRLGKATGKHGVLAAAFGALALGLMPTAQAAEVAGITVVADGTDCGTTRAGSSNPTFYSSNHRLVVTAGGRQIALYDAHGSGQQLAWRDSGGAWRSDAAGFLAEDLANDRTGSVALVRTPSGAEQAWLVWAGYETAGTGQIQNLPLELRRLTNLDGATGPTIGAEVQVRPVGMGNLRPDIAFENGTGVVSWVEKVGAASFELKTTTFTDLSTNTPSFSTPVVVATSSNAEMTATLVETSQGVKMIARTDKLRVFTHSPDFTSWTASVDAIDVAADARPSAVDLASGDILVSASDGGAVKVARFPSAGSGATVELTLGAGYREPSIASDGAQTWLFAVRSDGDVVSRLRGADGVWSTQDSLEIDGGAYGNDLAWPNLVRDTDGWLRALVDGPRCEGRVYRNWVLAYQRPASDTPPPPPPSEDPSLSINDVTVTEGNDGTKAASFTVRLSQASADTVTVNYATENGTAVARTDYRPKTNTLTFLPGVVSKKVSVAVKGDTVAEATETFFLRLSGATNATISDDLGQATIIDND